MKLTKELFEELTEKDQKAIKDCFYLKEQIKLEENIVYQELERLYNESEKTIIKELIK